MSLYDQLKSDYGSMKSLEYLHVCEISSLFRAGVQSVCTFVNGSLQCTKHSRVDKCGQLKTCLLNYLRDHKTKGDIVDLKGKPIFLKMDKFSENFRSKKLCC